VRQFAVLAILSASLVVQGQGSAKVSLDDLEAFETRLQTLVDRVLPATVGIRHGGAQGSGVIVTPEGHVLTAAHIFDDPHKPCTIVLQDGRKVKGTTLGRETAGDFGIVKIDDKGPWPHVTMGTMKEMKNDDPCFATGHPGGFQIGRSAPVRFGRITRTSGTFIRTSAVIDHGDSGGPLFDLRGKVIGIHSRIQFRPESNYHVSVDKYRDNWERLIAGKSWSGRRPSFGRGPILGIRVRRASGGCRVEEVYPDRPAEKAGLRRGDIILKMDGVAVVSEDDLVDKIRQREPGDEVDLEISRGEDILEISVVLGGG